MTHNTITTSTYTTSHCVTVHKTSCVTAAMSMTVCLSYAPSAAELPLLSTIKKHHTRLVPLKINAVPTAAYCAQCTHANTIHMTRNHAPC
jgi:hypothetical protein